MISFVCPSCGEPYKLEFNALPDYEKMFCSKCNRKLLHVSGKIYIYAWETSVQGDAHSVACPHCLRHFEFPIKTTGVYPCPACKKPFYTTANLPPLPDNAQVSDGMAFADVKIIEPVSEIPDPPHIAVEQNADPEITSLPHIAVEQNADPEITEQFQAAPPQPQLAAEQNNDLLHKISQLSEELARVPRLPELDKKIKVGLPRPKTGILGIFIGFAEKLCGN